MFLVAGLLIAAQAGACSHDGGSTATSGESSDLRLAEFCRLSFDAIESTRRAAESGDREAAAAAAGAIDRLVGSGLLTHGETEAARWAVIFWTIDATERTSNRRSLDLASSSQLSVLQRAGFAEGEVVSVPPSADFTQRAIRMCPGGARYDGSEIGEREEG